MKKPIVGKFPNIKKRVDLLIIAGEHSGDQHAAELVKQLRSCRPDTTIATFGGSALKHAGATLIFDMTKFSVVGLYEVIVNFFFFARLLKSVYSWILTNKPRAICFVDYPGFNLRLAKMLFDNKIANKSGGDIKLLYYISPQVWAWKAKRKYQIAKMIDSMATILPFEKQFFSNTNLDVLFVGHPFIHEHYKHDIIYKQNGPILLSPGSRKSAIKAIFPMLLESFSEILKHHPEKMAVVVYPNEEILNILRKILNKHFSNISGNVTFVSDGIQIGASAAIMSSGTMSLKCCLAGIPGAIVYKTHPLTYAIGKAVVKIKFLGMANILLGKGVWREFLQSRFRPKSVAKYIIQCTHNEKSISAFETAAQELKQKLSRAIDMSVVDWIITAMQ